MRCAVLCDSITFHPSKPVVCTTSDDRTWKMWSSPTGELILSGAGHTEWLSSAAFHPKAHALLCTGAGDATVKVWDFLNGRCMHTFAEHKHVCALRCAVLCCAVLCCAVLC
jgi:WD40 repeat protein